MATHKSAMKQHRRNLARRLRNRRNRSRFRSAIKQFRQAIESGDLDTARTMLPSTLSLVDRSAKLGAMHRNTAARVKSQLSRAVIRAATAQG